MPTGGIPISLGRGGCQIKAIRKKHELFAYITENNDLKLNEKIIFGYIKHVS